MRRHLKIRVGRILTLMAIAAAVIGFATWRYLRPKIHTASLSEVLSVLPKDLVKPTNRDATAEARFKNLIGAIGAYDTRAFRKIVEHTSGIPAAAVASNALWDDGRLSRIEAVLDSGPIRLEPVTPGKDLTQSAETTESYLPALFLIKQLERALIASADAYRLTMDYRRSTRCILAVVKIANDFWELQGPLTYYIDACSVESAAVRATTAWASQRTTPADACAEVLKALSPSPISDDSLVLALRNQFEQEVLPRLPDPYDGFQEVAETKEYEAADTQTPFDLGYKTSYDAMETARQLGQIYSDAIANAQKPLSLYEDSAGPIERHALQGLPMPPNLQNLRGSKRAWEKYRFRLATYNADNYFGRVMISDTMNDNTLVEVSDRWRAQRSAARILLASRVYRSAHSDTLPETDRDLADLLGGWPIDPYDGEAMHYLPRRQVTYSVGPNLRDDGGNVGGPQFKSKDIGFSLAFPNK